MKPSYVAVGLIGLALGGLWYTGGGTRPPTAQAADQIRVSDPVTHENLAVFFVRGPDTVDDSLVVTLQEAIERKWAVVHETGQVNELAVENLSADYELFVQSGDMIKGGRQDRLIASDLLVPPASGRVAVRVHCVEAGRWTGRSNDEAARFNKSDSYAVGNDVKLANAYYDQSRVWENVKVNQDKLTKTVGVQVNAAESPTSLQLALENPAVRAKAEAYRQALGAAGEMRGVVGAVFVVNGKVTSAEVYGSNGLFRKAWPKLLKAASEEALAEKAADRTAHPPTARVVEMFLASAAKAEPTEAGQSDARGVTGRSGATRQSVLRASGGNDPAPFVLERLNNADVGPEVNQTDSVILGRVAQTEGVQLPAVQSAIPNSEPALQEQQRRVLGNLNPRFRRANPSGPTPDVIRDIAGLEPAQNPSPQQPVNPNGNRLSTNRVENPSTLMLEAKDSVKNVVIHRSYIKK
ncbi:MAG: hypothetical protein JWO38_7365 [Gemmataceae bacterium]|nr:hypothetical protein [Gemmataceae bacterium]